MSTSVLEIVELPSGEVVLRRADGEGEPLVAISFSKDARLFMGDASLDIGKAMVGDGVQMVGQLYSQDNQENQDSQEESGTLDKSDYHTLH